MIAALLRRRRSGDGQRGNSLPELLVTMLIVGLLGSATVLAVTAMARQGTAANLRMTSTQQAQTSIDRIGREVRASAPLGSPATSFTYAGPTHLTLTSSLGSATGPTLVDLNVVSGVLVETTKLADAGSGYTWTGPAVTRNLAQGVVTGSTVFTYYNSSGTVLATPMTTAAQTAAIDHIAISLVLKQASLGGAVTVSTTVYPRNLEYHG